MSLREQILEEFAIIDSYKNATSDYWKKQRDFLADQILALFSEAIDKALREHIISVKTDLPRPFSKNDLIESIKKLTEE